MRNEDKTMSKLTEDEAAQQGNDAATHYCNAPNFQESIEGKTDEELEDMILDLDRIFLPDMGVEAPDYDGDEALQSAWGAGFMSGVNTVLHDKIKEKYVEPDAE